MDGSLPLLLLLFGPLPCEDECKTQYYSAKASAHQLELRAREVGEFNWWRAEQLRLEQTDMEKVAQCWWAIWWVIWSNSDELQREAWARELYHLDEQAFRLHRWPLATGGFWQVPWTR